MALFARSAALLRQSFNVLRHDKRLVIFPLLSSIACLAVLASFVVPLVMTGVLQQIAASSGTGGKTAMHPYIREIGTLLTFVYYFANYFVIVFFNTALVACAMERFAGREPTVGGGLRHAMGLMPQIVGWVAVSATVGTLLKAIEDHVGFVGKLVTGLVGFAWTIATYFVVPVLVAERLGPIEAVQRSSKMLSKTWGTALISNVGLGVIGFLLYAAATIPAIVGIVFMAQMNHWAPIVIGGGIMVMLMVGIGLVTSAVSSILVAALYRYAATGEVPGGFEESALRGAFRVK
ncbi:MAG: hypothetical protein K2Y21_07415 [Phycisphaerales bacterium]|nr:hypothetical protein [Phycisphaerales bacterium]